MTHTMPPVSAERWLPVVGYEGLYEVSSGGQVRGVDRINTRGHRVDGRILSPGGNGRGYLVVNLYQDGNVRHRKVHQLVLEAFTGPRPDGMEVRHLDGDKMNNQASNLAWGTQSENQLDNVRHGIHPHASKTRCPADHPYDGDNLYTAPSGWRHCRTCMRKNRT